MDHDVRKSLFAVEVKKTQTFEGQAKAARITYMQSPIPIFLEYQWMTLHGENVLSLTSVQVVFYSSYHFHFFKS